MSEEPLLKPDNYTDLSEYILLPIPRRPEDPGASWESRRLLILWMLRRDEEVVDCEIDFDGGCLVALRGEGYSIEALEEVEERLRGIIAVYATL